MASSTLRVAAEVFRAIRGGVVILGLSLASVQSATVAQETPSFTIQDLGVVPRPAFLVGLLRMEPVPSELGITDAQKKAQEAIVEGRFQKLQQARRDNKDMAKFREARGVILRETDSALLESLTPGQRERLEQIRIQLEGPLAFAKTETEFGLTVFTGTPLTERLALADEQVRRVRVLIEEGEKEIAKSAHFPIALDSKNGPPTVEAIRALVESPEFQAAKQKARQAGREAIAAVIRRIEDVLTDEQRGAYHTLRGAPFDLSRLRWGWQNEREVDLRIVAAAFGLGGGQRADPNFDTKVARPAYTSETRRPRVLFDEAHHNFHTAGGRYKPFAELIANDGYKVIPNGERLSQEVLQKGDVLVIANALGAEGMGAPEASNPAFTDGECDAVRDWIKAGGSLLFITDHAPFGAAAECLAKRLGFDLSKGATSDPVNSQGGATSLVFTRENHLLGDHPITRGREDSERVNRIQTFTGTSIKGPEGSIPILKLADTALDSSYNDDKPVSAAGRAQGIAFRSGRGRVVVLGEAAELSAQVVGLEGEKFGMNVPGLDNRQMALNIMHWLAGLLEPREDSP